MVTILWMATISRIVTMQWSQSIQCEPCHCLSTAWTQIDWNTVRSCQKIRGTGKKWPKLEGVAKQQNDSIHKRVKDFPDIILAQFMGKAAGVNYPTNLVRFDHFVHHFLCTVHVKQFLDNLLLISIMWLLFLTPLETKNCQLPSIITFKKKTTWKTALEKRIFT